VDRVTIPGAFTIKSGTLVIEYVSKFFTLSLRIAPENDIVIVLYIITGCL
jgi:hypothetical protein